MAKQYGYKYKNTVDFLEVRRIVAKNKAAFQKSYWFLEYRNKEEY